MSDDRIAKKARRTPPKHFLNIAAAKRDKNREADTAELATTYYHV